MKKSIYIVLLSFNSILTLVMILFTGIIRTYIDMYLPLGALLVFPLFVGIVYICQLILLSVGMALFIPALKHRFIFNEIICLILFISVLFLPYTETFGIINYKINYNLRKEFVESLDNEIRNYLQIDEDTYFVKDLRLSYTGTVMIDSSAETTKVMFYTGPSSYVIVYSSDKSGVADGDFSSGLPNNFPFKFKNVVQLDEHWCLAVVD